MMALGESGSKDYTSKDKVLNILRIANGGKLPTFIDLKNKNSHSKEV